MKMNKTINLDCDGTWIDLYGVDGWLDDLENQRVRPYLEAKPLVNLSALARVLNHLQREGWEINIISWTSKSGGKEFHSAVTEAKKTWLAHHIPSVKWNNIFIVPYGTPKQKLAKGFLFDDEKRNRDAWGEGAYDEENLIDTLRSFLS